jgi:hypothetical protein
MVRYLPAIQQYLQDHKWWLLIGTGILLVLLTYLSAAAPETVPAYIPEPRNWFSPIPLW